MAGTGGDVNEHSLRLETETTSRYVIMGLFCSVCALHAFAIDQYLKNVAQTPVQTESKPIISAMILPQHRPAPAIKQKSPATQPKTVSVRHPLKKTSRKITTSKKQLHKMRIEKKPQVKLARKKTEKKLETQTKLNKLTEKSTTTPHDTNTQSNTPALNTTAKTDAPVIPLPVLPPPVVPPKSHANHLHNAAPVYPRTSKRLGEQGEVILRLLVLADGSVDQLSVKQSSQHPRLDKAALRAVRKWRYVPATQAGKKIQFWHEQSIVFSLRNR